MQDLMINVFISVLMVILTTVIFYDILRYIWGKLPEIKLSSPRNKTIFVVIGIFAGHTTCVWLYGLCYYVMVEYLKLGDLAGDEFKEFIHYVYFSAETYSSLGIGDFYPVGNLRFIAGVEVLNGLVLIGWSVSFTYLAMEKFWDMHNKSEEEKGLKD